jgi:hypothetical protein
MELSYDKGLTILDHGDQRGHSTTRRKIEDGDTDGKTVDENAHSIKGIMT